MPSVHGGRFLRDTHISEGPAIAEQAEEFLKAASEDRYYLIYLLALETGMRIGELLALHWEEVDFEHESLTVRHTLSKYTLKAQEPKTPQGRRRIEVRPSVMSALREFHDALETNGKLGSFGFTDTDGGPIRENNLRRRSFAKILEKAELPRMRLHDLRHTHATMLLSAGVNPKIVSERLGHSSIRITLDLYGHVTPSMQKERRRLSKTSSVHGRPPLMIHLCYTGWMTTKTVKPTKSYFMGF